MLSLEYAVPDLFPDIDLDLLFSLHVLRNRLGPSSGSEVPVPRQGAMNEMRHVALDRSVEIPAPFPNQSMYTVAASVIRILRHTHTGCTLQRSGIQVLVGVRRPVGRCTYTASPGRWSTRGRFFPLQRLFLIFITALALIVLILILVLAFLLFLLPFRPTAFASTIGLFVLLGSVSMDFEVLVGLVVARAFGYMVVVYSVSSPNSMLVSNGLVSDSSC